MEDHVRLRGEVFELVECEIQVERYFELLGKNHDPQISGLSQLKDDTARMKPVDEVRLYV